jgi:hypothetical protein
MRSSRPSTAAALTLLLALSACSGASSAGPIFPPASSTASPPPSASSPAASPSAGAGGTAADRARASAASGPAFGGTATAPAASAASPAGPAPGRDAQASPNFGGGQASPQPSGSAGLTVGAYTPFKDAFGRLRVAGYLVNSGRQAVSGGEAVVDLEDSAGRVLQEQRSIYARDLVPPGQRTPFLAVFLGPPPDWTTAAVKALGRPAQPTAEQTDILKLVQTENVKPSESGRGFAISGEVKNGWTKPVTDVTVLGILYDATGKPLDVRASGAAFDTLAPSKTAPFAFEFYNSQSRPPAQLTYDLYVEAAPAP